MVTLNFILILIALMLSVSFIVALMIEAIKKVVTEEVIKRRYKSLEIFSLIFTCIISFFAYLVFLLFYIHVPILFIDIVKLIVVGILFIIACGCGSQVGYDKVIKTIKQIIEIFKGGGAIEIW